MKRAFHLTTHPGPEEPSSTGLVELVFHLEGLITPEVQIGRDGEDFGGHSASGVGGNDVKGTPAGGPNVTVPVVSITMSV